MGFSTETEQTICDRMADFLKESGATKKDKIEADSLRLSILAGLADDEEDGQHNMGAPPKVLRPSSMTWIANRPGLSKGTMYKGAASEYSHVVLFIRWLRPPPPPPPGAAFCTFS